MILPTDILEILKARLKEYTYITEERSYRYNGGYERKTKSLGNAIPESELSLVANEIYTKVAETYQENAEMSAKVKTYEAIIENSNFKMAIQRKKDVKNNGYRECKETNTRGF